MILHEHRTCHAKEISKINYLTRIRRLKTPSIGCSYVKKYTFLIWNWALPLFRNCPNPNLDRLFSVDWDCQLSLLLNHPHLKSVYFHLLKSQRNLWPSTFIPFWLPTHSGTVHFHPFLTINALWGPSNLIFEDRPLSFLNRQLLDTVHFMSFWPSIFEVLNSPLSLSCIVPKTSENYVSTVLVIWKRWNNCLLKRFLKFSVNNFGASTRLIFLRLEFRILEKSRSRSF